jgi:hypothetical protein
MPLPLPWRTRHRSAPENYPQTGRAQRAPSHQPADHHQRDQNGDIEPWPGPTGNAALRIDRTGKAHAIRRQLKGPCRDHRNWERKRNERYNHAVEPVGQSDCRFQRHLRQQPERNRKNAGDAKYIAPAQFSQRIEQVLCLAMVFDGSAVFGGTRLGALLPVCFGDRDRPAWQRSPRERQK